MRGSKAALLVLFFSVHVFAKTVNFPTNFRWCVATSAHQIEGGNFASDWWRFENEPGRMKRPDNSAVADDHWHRVNEDIGLLKALNVTDYRMSIEWAKIEPAPGRIDSEAVEHYRQEVKALIEAGIRPIVTLHHFSLPQWVSDRGGFEWEGFTSAFARFTRLTYKRIAPEVSDWVTVNEPMIYAIGGYTVGQSPPGEKRDWKGLGPVLIGILKAHAAAYHTLHDLARARDKSVRVGMAHHLRTIDPYHSYLPTDRAAAAASDEAFNWALPEALESGRLRISLMWMFRVNEEVPGLAGTQDFIGINYYSGDLIHLSLLDGIQIEKRAELPASDLGWPIYPEGFLRILRSANQRIPGKPIVITENGIADGRDNLRPKFILDHLSTLAQAVREGIPIEGYCHWSLYDNFEWFEGYEPRFGLFEVDYKTQTRKARPSALLFSAIAAQNGF